MAHGAVYFAPDSTVFAGAPAIDRYAENEGEGRLVQSIKSHLASATFTRTMISGKTWTLEALIAEFLRGLRAGAGAPLGARAVVGRPVRYWGAGSEPDDARAVGRMRAALLGAGFTDVVFEFEPIAAALRYAARLDHDELLLVADFGGGTSDFSLVRVGPGVSPGDPNAILATGGLAIGGDAFDARIIDAVVAPALGRDTSSRKPVNIRSRSTRPGSAGSSSARSRSPSSPISRWCSSSGASTRWGAPEAHRPSRPWPGRSSSRSPWGSSGSAFGAMSPPGPESASPANSSN